MDPQSDLSAGNVQRQLEALRLESIFSLGALLTSPMKYIIYNICLTIHVVVRHDIPLILYYHYVARPFLQSIQWA